MDFSLLFFFFEDCIPAKEATLRSLEQTLTPSNISQIQP